VVKSSIITMAGPLAESGFAAGISVEGPIASDSIRVRLAGAVVERCVFCSSVRDTEGSIDGGLAALSGSCAAVFADGVSVTGAGNVLSSTGLVDNAAFSLLVGRESAGWGALGAGIAPVAGGSGCGVAILAGERLRHDNDRQDD